MNVSILRTEVLIFNEIVTHLLESKGVIFNSKDHPYLGRGRGRYLYRINPAE